MSVVLLASLPVLTWKACLCQALSCLSVRNSQDLPRRAADIDSMREGAVLSAVYWASRLCEAVLRRDPASQLGVHEADQRHQSPKQQPDWCAAANHGRPLCERSELSVVG